jgi:hypothetical protein
VCHRSNLLSAQVESYLGSVVHRFRAALDTEGKPARYGVASTELSAGWLKAPGAIATSESRIIHLSFPRLTDPTSYLDDEGPVNSARVVPAKVRCYISAFLVCARANGRGGAEFRADQSGWLFAIEGRFHFWRLHLPSGEHGRNRRHSDALLALARDILFHLTLCCRVRRVSGLLVVLVKQ